MTDTPHTFDQMNEEIMQLRERVEELERSNRALNACTCPNCDRLRHRIAELEAALRYYIEDPDVLEQALKGGAK